MAHTKAGGAANRTVDVAGKRLGIKKFAGEYVKSGNIIVRQRGTKFHAGNNTMVGRDHTIFAVANGFVTFRQMTGYKRAKKFVDVVPQLESQDKPQAKSKQDNTKKAIKKKTSIKKLAKTKTAK